MKNDRDLRQGCVQSVDRALDLLEILGREPQGCRLTDLSMQSGLAPSTVHRLLTTLENRQFVTFNRNDGHWHIGHTSFSVGSTYARGLSLSAPAVSILKALRDTTRETANLGIMEDGEMLLLSQIESREIARSITSVGGKVPLVASGIGKAMLTSFPDQDVAAVVRQHGLHRWTSKSITCEDELRSQLKKNRSLGYAVDDEEHAPGLVCVAAPVFGREKEPVCAISVSGLRIRMPPERLQRVGRQVLVAAKQLSVAIGGTPPDWAH